MTDDSNTSIPEASQGGVIVTDWSELSRKGSKSKAKKTEEKTSANSSKSKSSIASRFNPPKLSTSNRKRSRAAAASTSTTQSRTKFKARPAPSSTKKNPTSAPKRTNAKKKPERGNSSKTGSHIQRKENRTHQLSGRVRSGCITKNNSKTTEKGKKKPRGTKKATAKEKQEAKQTMQRDEEWYRQGFERFDQDKDGKISFEDFAAAMNSIGKHHLTHKTLSIMFNKADSERNGHIELHGFLELLRNAEVFEEGQENDTSSRRRKRLRKKD